MKKNQLIYTNTNRCYDLEKLLKDSGIRCELFSIIKSIEKEKSKSSDTISLIHANVARLVESWRKRAMEKGIDLGNIIINYRDKKRKFAIDIYFEKYKLGIDVDGPVGHPAKDDIEKINYYREIGIRLLKVRSTKCEPIKSNDVILMTSQLTIKTSRRIISKLSAILGIDVYSYEDVKSMIYALDEADFIIKFYFENNKPVFREAINRWAQRLDYADTAKIAF